MSLTLHNLKSASGARKKKKRLGRGNASGRGTYSTRGIKGQKSRSGVSGLKRLGFRQVVLATPKKKGFTSKRSDTTLVNFSQINNNFKENDVINISILKKEGIIVPTAKKVKILNSGELNLINLNFSGILVSESARKKIEEKGGKIS